MSTESEINTTRREYRVEYKHCDMEVTGKIMDLDDKEDKEDKDPTCKKSPTGEHVFEMSDSQALVIGSTCYYCIHCGKHKDVYHHYKKSQYTQEELERMSD